MSKEYHILSLSGGKDSTALAFYIKENMPEIHKQIEYVFCDTGVDLPETYEYLNKIEVYLNKKIKIIKPEKSFEHILAVRGFLPSFYRRWCTVELKTNVFKKFIEQKQNKKINMYIGIRSDEAQRADISREKNVFHVYPFIENSLSHSDIMNILNNSGIGLPDYYKWRSRSGCYFCFFQSKMDWIKLYRNHPDLFYKAMSYEYNDCDLIKAKRFGWNVDMPLSEIIKPENIEKIESDYKKNEYKKIEKAKGKMLLSQIIAN